MVTYKIAMKNLFLLFLIPIQFVSYNVFSQSTFETTIGGSGEEVSSKSIYSNGKIYTAGHTTSIGSGSYDIVFTRLDGNGNLIGSTIAGLAGEDISLSAAVTNKNEFTVIFILQVMFQLLITMYCSQNVIHQEMLSGRKQLAT